MAWAVELAPSAERDLERLDGSVAKRVLGFLETRIAGCDDPRRLGRALQGLELGSLWRYRVGDYRVLCSLQDGRCVVLALRIGHRSQIYRR